MQLKDYLKTNYQKVALLTAPSDSCLKKSACVKVHFSDIFEAKESKSGFFSACWLKLFLVQQPLTIHGKNKTNREE